MKFQVGQNSWKSGILVGAALIYIAHKREYPSPRPGYILFNEEGKWNTGKKKFPEKNYNNNPLYLKTRGTDKSSEQNT